MHGCFEELETKGGGPVGSEGWDGGKRTLSCLGSWIATGGACVLLDMEGAAAWVDVFRQFLAYDGL